MKSGDPHREHMFCVRRRPSQDIGTLKSINWPDTLMDAVLGFWSPNSKSGTVTGTDLRLAS